jgi:hypothetical protein
MGVDGGWWIGRRGGAGTEEGRGTGDGGMLVDIRFSKEIPPPADIGAFFAFFPGPFIEISSSMGRGLFSVEVEGIGAIILAGQFPASGAGATIGIAVCARFTLGSSGGIKAWAIELGDVRNETSE